MIPSLTELKIKAQAYDRLFEIPKFGNHSEFTWECHWRQVQRETVRRLEAATLDDRRLNEQLVQSRMRRLLSTQFVYAPKNSMPEIVGRGREILRENIFDAELPNWNDAYEFLCQKEQELFDTEDEAIVFWRGEFLWSFYTLPDQNGLFARCTYFLAHRYDGDVWTDPRHVPKTVFRIDPSALAPDARRYVNENQNRFTGIMPTPKEPR